MVLSSGRAKEIVAVAALVAALGLLAVRRLPRLLLDRATYSDGAVVYQDLDGLRHAVWSAPEPLGEAVNTPAREGRPALSPDGRWLVFAVGEPGLSCDLWIAELLGGEPQQARPLTGLCTPADELAPAFGEDRLYFASDRPGGEGGYDLWVAPFADGLVGEAESVAGGLNSPADELDPAFARTADGERLLAFASSRARGPRGDLELYLAALDRLLPAGRGEVELERLSSLCSVGDDREPAFALDGRALYLASDRQRPGDFALYRSLREGETWLPARRVEGPGLAGARAPAPSADGFTLLFEGDAPAATGRNDRDLWRARSIEVLRRPPPSLGWTDLLLVGLLLATALLAWLARRWHELDVLYKCFLASVVAHLLLMWLLQDVRPEAEPQSLREGEGPTFQVRVLDDSSLATRTRERGGSLDPAPARELSPAGPARHDARVPASGPAQAPVVEVARAAGALAAAPARGEDTLLRASSPEVLGSARVEAPQEAFERLDDVAPPVELSARALARRQGAPPPSEPEEVDLARLAAQAARSASAPDRADLQAPRAHLTEGPAPREGPAGRAEALSQADLEFALEGPLERFERSQQAPTSQPALPEAARFVPTRAPQAGGPRAWQDTEERIASAPRQAGAPAGRALQARPADLGPVSAPDLAAPDVERGPRSVRTDEGLALAQPAERFEPAAPGGAPAPGPSLPPASSFVPSRPDPAGARGPERWSAPVAAAAPVPARPEPAEALAPRLREDLRGLPEAPRRLDDTPYRSRFGDPRRVALAEHGGGEDTELAVARGLAYLASIQGEDGAWGDARLRDRKYRQVAIGKTGLALLAFLGAGHTPDDGQHAQVVSRAVEFLLASQDGRRGHFGDGSAYSHGIATYALAELFALTQDERLRAPLERAVRQVLRNQVARGDRRLVGGWSYYYADGAVFDRWPRVSITAWQVMALESARLGGLEVPDVAFDAARSFLLRSWDPRLGAFRYSHDPSRLRSGYPTLPGSTPAALFALGLLGVDVADEPFAPARRFTLERAPAGWRWRGDDAFVSRASGNLYFWYYGSLALFRLGGKEWERWNVALKETLLPAQQPDGSWEPLDVYARYAGDDAGDRSYTTAMCVLSLEIYYRYFTPLLEVR